MKSKKDPMDENCWDMIYLNFCPSLLCCSFTIIFSMFITAVFIVNLSVDGLSESEAVLKSTFLPVNKEGFIFDNLSVQFAPITSKY